jgi:nucleoid-associated protein YgaU
MDNGQAIFRPTVGGGVQAVPIPSAAVPASITNFTQSAHSAVTNTAGAHAAAAHPGAHADQPIHSHAKEAAADPERGSLLGHHHEAGAQAHHVASSEHHGSEHHGATAEHHAPHAEHHSESGEAPQTADAHNASAHDYTVKNGDSLWKIAHEQLGNSSKWHDIYQMNHDLLGDNPSMIHSGATLHLPGAGHDIASNYTVHSGDNLWDISKAHLGGGQHWPELYHNNSDLIGSNPSVIHPGQHLSMSDHGGQLADGGHHQISHQTSHHEMAHGTSSHHGAHDAGHAKVAGAHNKLASTAGTQMTAGSQQVPQALAQTPGGAGMHADQPMGKLETSASPVQSYDQ